MKKHNILMGIFLIANVFMLTKAQSPGGITPQLWYKADAGITSSAGTVTQWNNSVPSTTYNLAQQGAAGTTPAYNTSQINFNPSLRFDGTNDRLAAANVPLTATTTAAAPYQTSQYIVYRKLGTTFLPLYSHSNGFGGTWNVGGNSDGGMLITNRSMMTSAPTTNEVRLQSLDGTSNSASVYLNGQLKNTMFANSNSTAIASPSTQNFWVGAQGTNNFANADIAEIVVYNTTKATERPQIESYLALKYGITKSGDYVASNGTVYWNISTNSGYNNNITGIARDDNSALNQKQSMSINAGQQILIGLTGMANTNTSNTGTLTNLQSLVIGDNGLAKAPTVPISSISGVNYLFSSVWKVQNTGSVGTVRVMWPQGLSNLKLVQNNLDPTFATGNTVTDMSANTQTINGVVYNYADVSLANGQFFTLAAFVQAPGGVISGLKYWYDAGITATLTNWTDKTSGFTISKNGTGAILLSNGDANSNYNPFYTFSATDYAHFTGIVDQTVLGRLQTTFAVGAKSGNTHPTYNHIFRFANIASSGAAHSFGLGIDNTGAPFGDYTTLHYIDSGTLINAQNTTTSPVLNKMVLLGAQASSVVSGNNKQVGYNGKFSTFSDAISDGGLYPNLQIGGSIFGFAGRIAEVAYYNASLSTLNRDKVDSYFAIKYGITLVQPLNYLNSDGNIVWNSSANTVFNNNIFGIARDVNGTLDQKISHSINDNSILTASTVNDFTSPNSTATRTSLTDKGFMMFGDNNINTGTTPVSCPALESGTERINKTWLVQETGTADAAYFQVDLSSYNINSEIALYVADDSGFTTNTAFMPAVSVSGGKAVFYYNFKNGQYFTVVGKVGPIACQTCNGGKQTLQNAQAWFNGGTTGMNNNTLSNVPLTGATPASGALSADINVTYPSGVEWIPTFFPRMFGTWTQLSRYDDLNGAAGKVSYTVNLKDINGSKAAKTSFQVAGITKLAGQAAMVKIIGYCGATQVTPKLNYAYNSTPELNALLRRYTIDNSTGTATGTEPFLDFLDYATVNVDFEKPVEKIVIEWTINRDQVFSKVDFLYISDMSFVCVNPIEPNEDNVNVIASYIESQLPTCEEATLKLNIKNNNCISKAINISNVLPSGLQYVADSYVGLGTETPAYSGQNFSLNNLTVPSGNSYLYIKVKPSGAGTYATYFNYTVNGGINNPTPYRSDDDSGASGYQDTSITFTASTVIAKPTVTKSVNRCFGTSSTELEYTVNITNNDANPITSVEFMDNLDAAQSYVAGSLVQNNFTANGTASFTGGLLYISGMSIAPGQTAVVKFKVNTNNSATMAYTDTNGSKYLNNQATVSVDPQSQCGAANSVGSNLLKILACTSCTKDPNTSPADTITKIGITIQTKQNGWPENIPNGAVALESKTKGFVITRTQSSAIVNPVEGMLIYDTTDKCMKLYNGTSWHCVVRSCNE
ncbi:DUF11 domain-containing protein [Chryseobacterium viscerum]|uniref:DUF11 domain-containing protein n=1 Tax=Chryseobacterium viscerum TaxID=1037377 RepID=UPI001386C687|nr:DUF11 domain-containing protein [Chryseobacterium viscerum]